MFNKVSFVIPAYNEEESLDELYSQVMQNYTKCVEQGLVSSYEFVFVDDGSSDKTADKMKALNEKDKNVRYILFRKNFGKSPALEAAFRNITGDVIITMDADLQDDPVELPNMLAKLNEGFDMVVGWKVNRLDPMEKKLPSKLFNKVTSNMSGLKLHDFDCGYKAMRREVTDSIDVYGELHRYIPVLAYRQGFKITEIPVHHNKRIHGKSKYGFERYLRGLFDFMSVAFLAKYSDRPMYFFGKLGLGIGGFGLILCVILTIGWFMGNALSNRPILLLGVLSIMIGMQLLAIGFIGNMMVDATYRSNYRESNIKEKI